MNEDYLDRPNTLEDAIEEAERFIFKAKQAKKVIKAAVCEGETPWPCQYFAAAKRASMDLTRALARLRRARGF